MPTNPLEQERPYLTAAAKEDMVKSLKSKDGVSDLVQETMLKALRSLSSFSGHTHEEFRSWLRSIMKRTALNVRRRYLNSRKRNAMREVSLESLIQADKSEANRAFDDDRLQKAEISVAKAELCTILRSAINELSDDYREIILLRSIQQLPFDQIGDRLGKTGDNSRKLWCRAIENLKDVLRRRLNGISGV